MIWLGNMSILAPWANANLFARMDILGTIFPRLANKIPRFLDAEQLIERSIHILLMIMLQQKLFVAMGLSQIQNQNFQIQDKSCHGLAMVAKLIVLPQSKEI